MSAYLRGRDVLILSYVKSPFVDHIHFPLCLSQRVSDGFISTSKQNRQHDDKTTLQSPFLIKLVKAE